MSQICAHCGTEVDGDALFCPTCGQPLERGTEPELPPAPDWPDIPERPLTRGADGADDADDAGQQRDDAGEQPDEAVAERAAAEPRAAEPTQGEPPEAGEPPQPPQPEAPETPDEPAEPRAEGTRFDVPPFLEPTGGIDRAEPMARPTHAWDGPASAQPVPPWRRGAVHRAAEDEAARDEAARDEAASDETVAGTGANAAGAGAAGPARAEEPAAPPPRTGSRPAFGRPAGGRAEGFVELPQLLSEWLAGIGAVAGILAMFLPWRVGGRYLDAWGLASGVNIVMAVVLLGVVIVVFFPDYLPKVPQRALAMLAVGLVGVGIGFDRLGLPLTGAGGIVFLIAMIVVASGGAVAVLGHDRVVGGTQA